MNNLINSSSQPKEGAFGIKTQDNYTFFAAPELLTEVNDKWFEPAYWQKTNAITGTSKGRYTTYFIKYEHAGSSLKMVLRHYYRGGMVRHFSKDKFLYTGLTKTRVYQEFELLQHMTELGLPVPRPIAGMISQHLGVWCMNDILIEQIENASDGFHALNKAPLSSNIWQNIGQVIKMFHKNGIYHADLNIHNILIKQPSNEVFLIDFDRCEKKAPDTHWQTQNLDRLKRSLEKEKRLHSTFNYSEQDWQCLLTGYQK